MRWLLKRWWFWAGTGFMLVAVFVGYLVIPDGRISQAKCDRIQLGMTFEEVKSLLGDNYLPYPQILCSVDGEVYQRPFMVAWYDEADFLEGNLIEVTFKYGGREVTQCRDVIGKRFRRTKPSVSELLKRRIERRIKALWP
jgi:hypothetical protein